MIYNNILEAIGHTPVVRLCRMVDETRSARVLVKYEGLNVGGSIKTRTAYAMIQAAIKEGKIHGDTIIVEPTSGNQGIGLALIGAVMGIETIIIMPDSVSEERRKLVKHYGAEVILIHDAAKRMARENPKVFVPQQFDNPNNPLVHKHHTALELLEQVAGPIHGFCAGIGTGGTISGIGETLKALRAHNFLEEHAQIIEPRKVPWIPFVDETDPWVQEMRKHKDEKPKEYEPTPENLVELDAYRPLSYWDDGHFDDECPDQ